MEINFSSEDLQQHTDLDWSHIEDTTNASAAASGATSGGNNGADWELIHKDNDSQ